MTDLQKHNWDMIRDALEELQSYSEREEPHAVNFHAGIQTVLDGLPENE